MAPRLVDLTEDVLLAISQYLQPADLLRLNQTCRVLHAFGCTDYIWHRMKFNLPLDLPPHSDIKKLSAHELRGLLIQSLRLEQNWLKPASTFKLLTRVQHGDIICHMQLIGSYWLVTLSRSPTQARVSVWCIRNPLNAYRTTSFEVPLTTAKFSAATPVGKRDSLIIAVILGREELLRVYSAPLQQLPVDVDSNTLVPLSPLYTCSRDKFNGSLVEVQVCAHVVACAIARVSSSNTPGPTYQVWFFNLQTKVECTLNPNLTIEMHPPSFKLFQDKVAFVALQDRGLFFHIHSLPKSITTEGCKADSNGDSSSEPLARFKMNQVPENPHWQLSTGPTLTTPSELNALLFHAFSEGLGCGYMMRVPLMEQSHEQVQIPHIQQFATPGGTSAEIVCLGSTGRRAVWLEHNWEIHGYRLMKATFDEAYPRGKVDVLLSPHLALPFKPETCRSIAFNEASGRVCLGLHTGELYILDL